MRTLEGKTALVTGSGRNLWASIALALAEQGANVAVNVRESRKEAEAVADAVRRFGRKAMVVVADVSQPDDVKRMFKEVDGLGGVDILVNNAAIRPKRAATDVSVDEWDRVLDTNLRGPFLCAQQAIERMRVHGWGRIVNISGIDATVGMAERPHNVASKGGLEALTRALATEWGHHGVTVNTVTAGVMDTTRDLQHYPAWPPPPEWLRKVPIARLGKPDEFAATVAFLCSHEAGFITGQNVRVDGGFTKGL